VKNQRRVLVVGRSMQENVAMALELGYLDAPDGTLARPDELRRLRPNQVSIICTGAQGEPTSALVRMANRDHRQVRIVPGDTVVLSSTPIPGNESLVYRTIDNLFKQGANVLHSKIADVHVHGHAAQEELKLLLNLVSPKFFVPVHGEYRHLVAHSRLAASIGIGLERSFILEDGDILELSPTGGRVEGHLPSGHVYVDGMGELAHVVLRDRKLLSQDGILVVITAIEKESGRLVARPDIVSRGFIEAREGEPLLEETKDLVVKALEATEKHYADWSFIHSQVKDALGRFLYERTRRRPMILPVVVEV
ncbi:MAG: ribonuclease J, partial [Chloroflexi bacterium]|nr:ribonuclease J [Chloroflexota bacterium]